jgi:glycosyltransferase involved in cell wall biosynthesis
MAPGEKLDAKDFYSDLSIAIITRNEEKNIKDCLESAEWAGEIIVVDAESDDATAKLCADFGVCFYSEPWKGFSAQKNSAIAKATKKWVLSLDADERVTPELKRDIEEIIQSRNTKDGYFIARKNFFLGRWIRYCGWYPDYNLRLFKRGKGSFKNREVHEAVVVEGSVGYLKHPMEHYTYTSISDYLQRLDRYSTLAARELFKENKTYGMLHIIFRPVYTFLNMFVLRAGFWEGYHGFILSVLYGFYTFSKYIKLKELQRK